MAGGSVVPSDGRRSFQKRDATAGPTARRRDIPRSSPIGCLAWHFGDEGPLQRAGTRPERACSIGPWPEAPTSSDRERLGENPLHNSWITPDLSPLTRYLLEHQKGRGNG